MAARPDVYNHNLETVPRLYPTIRPGARYFHSLRLLNQVKELDPTVFTKSGIMVGLGETKQEVYQVMDDLRSADVDFITHRPVSSADTEACAGGSICHARGIRRLRQNGPGEGIPDGFRLAADTVVPPRGRGFCEAEGRAGGKGRRAGVIRMS